MIYFLINILVGFIVLITSLVKGKNKLEVLIYYTIGFFFIGFIGLKGNDDEYTKLFVLLPTLDLFIYDLLYAIEKGLQSEIFLYNPNSSKFLFMWFGNGS